MSLLQVDSKIVILNLKDERKRLKKPYGRDKIFMELHKSKSLTGKITKVTGNYCLVEIREYDKGADEFKNFGFQRKFSIEYLKKYSKKLI
jgi:hypothetical protein